MRSDQNEDVCLMLERVSRNFLTLKESAKHILSAVDLLKQAVFSGKKVFFCGNGGSAADAQHLSAELVGRYKIDRKPIAGIALTVDTSILTAISNDYGYEAVFSRQLEALGNEGDVLVALSTSGNSQNVVNAMKTAREKKIKTLALTGESGGKMKELADVLIAVPSTETNHIQEMHIVIGHYLCECVERSIV